MVEGTIFLRDTLYGDQMWYRVKTRKGHRCRFCHAPCAPGSPMYRPLTNGYNRMERICEKCVGELQEMLNERRPE